MRYHKGFIYGGDTIMLQFKIREKVIYNGESGIPLKTLMSWIKVMPQKRKTKEPKGRAEDGSYCPKEKAGQSWSYTKDRVEKENDREDVA